MRKTDARGVLDARPFAYSAAKDGKVFLYWQGKAVKTLSGKEAGRFLADVQAMDERQAQLLMAKKTGNFKRGNEKGRWRHGRRQDGH